MKLTLLPNKILRSISEEVQFPLSDEDKRVADAMIAHIRESKDPSSELRGGVGIAAVQFGYNKRMLYINMDKYTDGFDFEDFLINPVIVAESSKSASLRGGEGCLSVPEDWKRTEGLVHRKNKVVVEGYSYLQNKKVRITKIGYPAIVIQHEMDHLDGKLFIDRIIKGKEWETKNDEVLI